MRNLPESLIVGGQSSLLMLYQIGKFMNLHALESWTGSCYVIVCLQVVNTTK